MYEVRVTLIYIVPAIQAWSCEIARLRNFIHQPSLKIFHHRLLIYSRLSSASFPLFWHEISRLVLTFPHCYGVHVASSVHVCQTCVLVKMRILVWSASNARSQLFLRPDLIVGIAPISADSFFPILFILLMAGLLSGCCGVPLPPNRGPGSYGPYCSWALSSTLPLTYSLPSNLYKSWQTSEGCVEK